MDREKIGCANNQKLQTNKSVDKNESNKTCAGKVKCWSHQKHMHTMQARQVKHKEIRETATNGHQTATKWCPGFFIPRLCNVLGYRHIQRQNDLRPLEVNLLASMQNGAVRELHKWHLGRKWLDQKGANTCWS